MKTSSKETSNLGAAPLVHSTDIHVRLRPWDSFLTLYQREMARFIKVIFQTVFTPMINSVLYLLIFGVSLGKSITLDRPVSYLAFLIPGLIMMGVLNNAFQNSSSSIVSGKFSGDLEDLKVVPLTPQMIIWAMSIGGLTRGAMVGLITFGVGEVFSAVVDHAWIGVAHPFWLLFFLVVGGLTFAKLGITVAFYARTFDQLSAVTSFILTPLIYLGGVFFSIQGLHPFWQALSRFNPVLYLINGVRYGVLGISDVDISSAAVISLIFLVIFHLLGFQSLKNGDYQRW